MSSADLEIWVRHVTLGLARELTGEEEKELKRQRRLIKNRESAQASRQRKKAHVEELEAEIAGLKREKDELRDELTSLHAENLGLKREVGHLQDVIKRSGLLSTLWDNLTSIRKSGGDFDQLPANVKAAGVCLLMVLFSFGMFFNAPSDAVAGAGPQLPFLRAFHDAALPQALTSGRVVSDKSGSSAVAATSTTTTTTTTTSPLSSRRLFDVEHSAASGRPAAVWSRGLLGGQHNLNLNGTDAGFFLTCARPQAGTPDGAMTLVLPQQLLQQSGALAELMGAVDVPVACQVIDIAFSPSASAAAIESLA